MSKHVSYSEARQHLAAMMDHAVNEREAVVITRRGQPSVVLLAEAEYSSMMETLYLLSSRNNARRLFDALDQADAGMGIEVDLAELKQQVEAAIAEQAKAEQAVGN